MTPICKAHCSDVGFEVCRLAVQIFGGYGYIGEYPVEQCLRDQKIFSLYEGTNGVQAMDLLGRKMRRNSGALFMAWLQECNDELDGARAAFTTRGGRDGEGARLARAAPRCTSPDSACRGTSTARCSRPRRSCRSSGPWCSDCTRCGRRASRRRSSTRIRTAADAAFYKGKMLNAKFYSANILPQAIAYGKGIVSADDSALDPALFV